MALSAFPEVSRCIDVHSKIVEEKTNELFF
jgi:hypothetical protein